MVDKEIFALLV